MYNFHCKIKPRKKERTARAFELDTELGQYEILQSS